MIDANEVYAWINSNPSADAVHRVYLLAAQRLERLGQPVLTTPRPGTEKPEPKKKEPEAPDMDTLAAELFGDSKDEQDQAPKSQGVAAANPTDGTLPTLPADPTGIPGLETVRAMGRSVPGRRSGA